MIESKDTTPAEKDGIYRFELYYSGRDLACQVIKEQQILHVKIDNNLESKLKINSDGTLTQTEGATLPDSSIDFIKKQVLGLHA